MISLSYFDKPIASSEFKEDFSPDAKYLYQRKEGEVPERIIRANQFKLRDKHGPWLAGMTLDPAEASEAWCHQRGYVCFFEELHGTKRESGRDVRRSLAVAAGHLLRLLHRIAEVVASPANNGCRITDMS